MNRFSSTSTIKRAQKESVLMRLVAEVFLRAALDDPQIAGLVVNRVGLSPDKSICTVYFYSPEGKHYFDERLETLKLYKPSVRKAIAHGVQSRYTPDVIFRYDEQLERQHKIETLIDTLTEKEKL